MTDFVFNVEPGTIKENAHRVAVNNIFGQNMESFRYDIKTGIILVTVRAIPPFGDLPRESELSKNLNTALESYRAQTSVLAQRVIDLDKREADALGKEKELTTRDALLVTSEKQVAGEKKELDRQLSELRKGDKTTFVGTIKSFFHNIK